MNSNLGGQDIPTSSMESIQQSLVIILPTLPADVGLTHDLRCWVPVLIAQKPLPAWCPEASSFSICSSTTLPLPRSCALLTIHLTWLLG